MLSCSTRLRCLVVWCKELSCAASAMYVQHGLYGWQLYSLYGGASPVHAWLLDPRLKLFAFVMFCHARV